MLLLAYNFVFLKHFYQQLNAATSNLEQKIHFGNIFTEVVGLISPLTIVWPLALFFLAKIFFVKILRDRRFGGVRHLPDQNLKK